VEPIGEGNGHVERCVRMRRECISYKITIPQGGTKLTKFSGLTESIPDGAKSFSFRAETQRHSGF